MKRILITGFFSVLLSCQMSSAIPFLFDEKVDAGIVPVLDTQGMAWRNDLNYLTYLCMDELGALSFRSYPFLGITRSGIYKLADNVTNQITISVSNVTLDLNGCTVSGGTNGIVINGGLSNITIKNGVIDSVSSDGIQVGAGCSDIQIFDVEVKNALRAIDFEQVSNGVIKNCDLNSSTTGLELDGCHNITVRNCTARANTHAGYDLLASTTCSVIECSALSTGDGNVDISSEVFGFLAKDGNGNLFERCIANATQALQATDYDSIVAGFALRGSESCTKIIDSEASNSETNVNGVVTPHGILLEGTIDSTQSVAGDLDATGRTLAVEWSPDGNYIAVGGDGGSTGGLKIVSFDRVSETLTDVTTAAGPEILVLDWSPDGKYIAIGKSNTSELELFTFDATTETLTSVDVQLAGSNFVGALNFSPDSNYLVVGGNTLAGSGDEVQIFRVNKETHTLTFVDGLISASTVQKTRWSPDGRYIFVGGAVLAGSNEVQILRFDRATETAMSVAGALGTTGDVVSGEWSPDGKYLSVGGIAIAGDELQIFQFDRETETLTNVAGTLAGSAQIWSANWSADGNYLSVSGSGLVGSNEFQIWKFDRGSNSLEKVAQGLGTAGIAYETAWSPDGSYIAVVGDGISPNEFQIFSALQFPENNAIKNNTVYCNSGAQFPSGIGISGSSISNSIIGNTAFNNPIPRGANEPIVESNYAFVTNVFNQLFGDAPTLLQNISLSGIDPILNRYDIPTQLLRLEALAESLIDNLL